MIEFVAMFVLVSFGIIVVVVAMRGKIKGERIALSPYKIEPKIISKTFEVKSTFRGYTEIEYFVSFENIYSGTITYSKKAFLHREKVFITGNT